MPGISPRATPEPHGPRGSPRSTRRCTASASAIALSSCAARVVVETKNAGTRFPQPHVAEFVRGVLRRRAVALPARGGADRGSRRLADRLRGERELVDPDAAAAEALHVHRGLPGVEVIEAPYSFAARRASIEVGQADWSSRDPLRDLDPVECEPISVLEMADGRCGAVALQADVDADDVSGGRPSALWAASDDAGGESASARGRAATRDPFVREQPAEDSPGAAVALLHAVHSGRSQGGGLRAIASGRPPFSRACLADARAHGRDRRPSRDDHPPARLRAGRRGSPPGTPAGASRRPFHCAISSTNTQSSAATPTRPIVRRPAPRLAPVARRRPSIARTSNTSASGCHAATDHTCEHIDEQCRLFAVGDRTRSCATQRVASRRSRLERAEPPSLSSTRCGAAPPPVVRRSTEARARAPGLPPRRRPAAASPHRSSGGRPRAAGTRGRCASCAPPECRQLLL